MEVVKVYSYEYKNGHIEVYYNGEFQFTADNMEEALRETREVSGNE